MEMTAGGVEEIADLERARLGELYLRHGPSGLRLAYLLTGDRQLAEDLVQEACVRMAGRLAHLREPEAFNAYLRREESLASPEQPAGPDLELREYLWRTLLRLPPRQRAALVLHYYEDLSERDAAEVLHCRPSTYRSLVARGMSALRTQIRSEGDG